MASKIFPQSLALVIGINDYSQGIPKLLSAVPDATRLASVLRDSHGYETHTLIDGEATLEEVRRRLNRLCNQATAEDRLFLYFAGHGIAAPGDIIPEGALLLHDANREGTSGQLAMSNLYMLLESCPCRHLLVTLDCCFAGAFRWAGWRDGTTLRKVIHREQFERFTSNTAWHLLTSAAHDEKALDVIQGDTLGVRDQGDVGHSPFAAALLRGLSGAADLVPREDGDGVITITELHLYLSEQLDPIRRGWRFQQTPGLWHLRPETKGEYVFLVPGREISLPPAPSLSTNTNPWRGLSQYEDTPEDRELFFGRAKVTQSLVEFVVSHPLTVVTGPSGNGKSSLVKAGLLPRFRLDSAPCLILPTIRPGPLPVTELVLQLRQAGVEIGESSIRSSDKGLTEALLQAAARAAKKRVLLVVDQLEEIVTLGSKEPEARSFLAALNHAAREGQEILRVVLTLRSDFEPHFSRTFGSSWQQARFVVPLMDRAELREVVYGPASVRLLFFEPPSLVERLIDEVALMPGGLPLLSFALTEMYGSFIDRSAGDRSICEEDFNRVGGVIGALRHRAENLFENLSQEQQVTFRRLILRMVSLEGGELARRRIPRSDLRFSDAGENLRVEQILGTLETARLVVASVQRQETGEDVAAVEPAHDALVRSWDRLLTWVHESPTEILSLSRLSEAVSQWTVAKNERDRRGLLWDDPSRTGWLRQILTQSPGLLNAQEEEFARQSLHQARSATRRLVVYAVTVTLAALMALGAFLYARERQRVAEQRDRESRAARLAAESELLQGRPGPFLSASSLLALESLRLEPSLAGDHALRTAINLLLRPVARLKARSVYKLVFDPRQRFLATASATAATVWEVSTWRQIRTIPHQDSLPGRFTVGFELAEGGKVLAEAAASGREIKGEVKAWALPSGHELYSFSYDQRRPVSLALRTDGGMLAFAGDDNVLHMVPLPASNPSRDVPLPSAPLALSFEASGSLIAACADGTVYSMDSASGTLKVLATLKGPFSRAIINPSAVALLGDGVSVWLRQNGTTALIPAKDAYNFVIDSDSTRIAALTSSGVEVFATDTGQRLTTLNPPSAMLVNSFDVRGRFISAFGSDNPADLGILALTFSKDGKQLITGGADATVRVWDLARGNEIARVEQSGPIREVATTLDGHYLLSAGDDPVVRVWDWSDRFSVRNPNFGAVMDWGRIEDPETAVHPSKKYIASALHYHDGTTWHEKLLVQSLPDLQRVGELEFDMDSAVSVAWRPGSEELAVGLQNEVRLCSRDLSRPCRRQALPSNAIDLAFEPGGSSLAIALGNNQVAFWHLATDKLLLAEENHQNNIVRIMSLPAIAPLQALGTQP